MSIKNSRTTFQEIESVRKELMGLSELDLKHLRMIIENRETTGIGLEFKAFLQKIFNYFGVIVVGLIPVAYLKRIANYSDSIIPFFLFTMLQTGFRFGEAMAITWDDIDFERNSIYTYRRYSSIKKDFTKPKTRTSIRRVPVSHDLKELLLELKFQQERMLRGLHIKNTDQLIFYDYRFGMISNNAVNKFLASSLEKLEIESKMSSTGARHTYGSYLLANGVDIWAVAKLMGHKDIKQLIETYGHLLLEVEEKENDQLLKILNNKGSF